MATTSASHYHAPAMRPVAHMTEARGMRHGLKRHKLRHGLPTRGGKPGYESILGQMSYKCEDKKTNKIKITGKIPYYYVCGSGKLIL